MVAHGYGTYLTPGSSSNGLLAISHVTRHSELNILVELGGHVANRPAAFHPLQVQTRRMPGEQDWALGSGRCSTVSWACSASVFETPTFKKRTSTFKERVVGAVRGTLAHRSSFFVEPTVREAQEAKCTASGYRAAKTLITPLGGGWSD